MEDFGGILDLLRTLVSEKLGPERVDALFKQLHTRRFDSYLLADPKNVPKAAEYTPKVFSSRGGVDYFRPDGWVQVWLTEIDSDPDFAALRGWPVAYHGTDSAALGSILEAGLRKPGELPTVQVKHGQAGAGPTGAIYATPSLWLASHPMYSTLLEVGPGKWAQFVFKLRVRPDSYTTQRSTLASSKHWDAGVKIDPNFYHNEALEWLIGSSSDVKVVGLMVRELGAAASPTLFGGLAGQVTDENEGAEYCWTRLLQQALQSGGHIIDNGTVQRVGPVAVWQIPSFRDKASRYAAKEAMRSPRFAMPLGSDQGMQVQLQLMPNESPGRMMVAATVTEFQQPILFELIVGLQTWRCLGFPFADAGLRDSVFTSEIEVVADGSACVVLRMVPHRIPCEMETIMFKTHRISWCLCVNALRLADWAPGSFVSSPAVSLNCAALDEYTLCDALKKCAIRFVFKHPQSDKEAEGWELGVAFHGKVTAAEQKLLVRYRVNANSTCRVFENTLGNLINYDMERLPVCLNAASRTGTVTLMCKIIAFKHQ